MSIRDIFPIDKWDFKTHGVLDGLSPRDHTILNAHRSEQLFRKGEIIFREGSFPSGIFYIVRGKAKKYKADKEGKEHIIYVANKGELLGYHALLSEERYPDSAAALEESLVAFIPREDFLDVLQESEVLGRRLLKTLSHEYGVLANSLSLFAQKSVRERLATQLIILREKYKVNFEPGMAVEINMSRDDLAALVGTGRENIVRILTEFKEEGILQTKGRKIIISNVKQLIKIAHN